MCNHDLIIWTKLKLQSQLRSNFEQEQTCYSEKIYFGTTAVLRKIYIHIIWLHQPFSSKILSETMKSFKPDWQKTLNRNRHLGRLFQTGLFLHAAVSRNGLILIFDSSILGMSTSIHTVHSFHPPPNFVWHFKYHKKNNDVSSQKSNKFNSQLPGQICLAK